ncbi:uncharacterized protein G2W53_016508 [Senna tora]|uniref:Uncharacterized protein n=1 Tax=Senna tora TaxID=362788 RepID=A0A834TW81_9FABA|nr:uncharacterized protein G2W53_016508 [Senna tora]
MGEGKNALYYFVSERERARRLRSSHRVPPTSSSSESAVERFAPRWISKKEGG